MRVLDADTITVTFTLSGDDADNYIKPDDTVFTDGVDGEVGINPLQLTVNNTIVTTIKTYDGNVSAAVTNNGILNGVIVGDIVDFGVSANYNSKSVIEADIVTIVYTLSGADKDNYVTPITYDIENGVEDAEVRIDPLQLTASDTLVTSSKEYDGNVTATVTDDGILSGVLSPEGIPDDVGFDSSAVFNSKNVIEADTVTVSYTLSGEDKDNYIAPISYNILGASITPKQLNAIGTTVDSEKVYDGTTDAEVTNIGTPDGIIDPDDVDFSVQADYNSKNVTVADTITVVYSLIGEDKDNYSAPNSYDIVDGVGATVSISQRQLLMNTPTLTPKTYDGTTAAKANVNADLAHPLNKISGDVLTLDYDAVYDDYTVLGVSIVTVTYMITGGADASNYTPADDYVIHDATINPLLLTASGAVASTNKIYDGTSTSTVTSVGTLSGVLSPEGTLDDVTLGANANFCYKQGEAYFNTAQVLTATFVKITFYLEGEDISNYTAPVSPVPVAATISKRQLIINDPSLSLTKVYDGTTAVSVTPGALQNKIETDSLTITATASYNSANVASANTITVVYTLSGTSKDNYIKPINKVYNSGVSISKLAVNISYTGLEQAYDGSVKAVGAEIVNYDAVKHAGFTISLIYLDGESNPFTPQNAGTYYVSIDMVSYNANYTCIDTAEFVITPSETTLTIDDLTITYNGISPSLNITILNQLGNPIYGIDVVLTYYRYINANWQIVDWLTYVYDPLDWEEVEGDAPSRAGVYRVIGEIEEGSNYYSDQAEALLKINKAVASVTLIQSSLTQSYGYVTGVEINTNPSQSEGHPMSFIAYYDGSEDLPTNAGTYSVDVQLDDYNYYGATSGTFIITKTDANAYVVLISDNPIILYDSEEEEFYLDYQLSLNLTASDFDAYVDIPGLEELPVDIILKQSEIEITCIISAGTYSVTATINDNNIAGTLTITLIVNKIEGTIEYTPESVTYSNETVSASGATTAPEECSVTYKYSYDEGDTYIYDEPVNAGYYPILIEINDANYFGSIYSSITIEQADTEISLSATVTRNYSGIAIDLSSLPQFTGDEVISPELIFNYYDDELNLLPSPPLNAGIYTLVVSFMERDNFIHPDSNTAQITINRATPVVTLQNGAFAYDGTAKTLTAEVIPAIAIEPQYFYYVAEGEEGSYTKGELLLSAPINVGVYIVLATVDEDELNYAAATSNEATLIITLGIASITVPSTSRTIEYSGNPVESVLVTTDPEGLDVVFEFTQGGVPVTPLIPGVYSVKATIDNETYVGETTFELTITKQLISEFINFSENRTFEYNGYARPVSATVQDHSVNLIITYSATGYASTTTAPKNAGTYNVTATISDTLYQGNASTSMIINKKLLVITADDIEDAEYGVEYPRKYTAVGFIAGIDSKNSLTKEPTLRIINEANDVNTIAFDSSIVVGTYTLMPENATAVNYYFEYHSGTMTVIKTSLTVSANNATVIEGTRATPIITYTGFKWQDNATTVFGNNKPIIKYLQGENTLNSVLPITPGVYQIIPDGGVADNYTLTYEAATLTVQADSLENAGQSLLLTGSFHPDTDLIVTELEKGSDRYKAAMSAARDQSLLYLYQYGIYLSLEQGNEQLAELDGHTEYSIKVPDKLIDQEFTLLFIADDGTCTVQNYTIANGYATGTLTVTGGTLVFVRSINILLILAVLGGILLLIGIIFLSKYLKRLKEESPKELSQAISPVVAEPLEALEDEDAAFDAYLEKLVEENIQADPNIIPEEEPVPQAEQSPNEDEDDINLGVNEAEYTKEELQRLKEKARKAKHKSVEDRITEEIERRLVESLTENKKEIQLQEFVPSAAAAAQDIADNSDITDEYIIDNELFPNSNTISMEESQALYPGRGIRRVGPKVALEVCFESALNLAEDKYKYIYSEIKNTFNSYNGVESRMFKSGEAFKGGAAHALIRMRNGIPVVYMNIDVKYIPEGTVYTDRSAEPKYKDSPIEIIVDDGKQLTAARTIISALMIIGGLEHNDKYKFINYIDKYPKIENAIMDES